MNNPPTLSTPTTPLWPRQATIILAIAAYLIVLASRLPGLFDPLLQIDEVLWIKRSNQVRIRLEDNPAQATTHLGHPGVVPALIIAAGQTLYESVRPIKEGEEPRNAAQLLKPSRLSATMAATLVVPAFVVGAAPIVGLGTATLGALWLGLDPPFYGYSRIVHLDAIMTLFVLMTVLLYGYGKVQQNRSLVLLSGITWGLAVLCKPTCIVLIPIFILWNGLCWLRSKHQTIISSAELWAIAIGHLVIALLWTRLWHHQGELAVRLGIKSKVAGTLYYSFASIQQAWYIALPLIGYGLWRSSSLQHKEFRSLVRLALLVLLGCIIAPAIPENGFRFWLWVAGLSHETHRSFGHIATPPNGSYLSLAWSFLPPLTLAAFCIGAWYTASSCWRLSEGRHRVLSLALLVALVWCLPLAVSAKQSWRYALPCIPFIYLVALYGLQQLASRSKRTRLAVYSGIAIILVFQGWSLFEIRSDPVSYVNPLQTNIGSLITEGRIRPRVGLDKAVAEIKTGHLTSDQIFVTTLGDASTVRLVADYTLGESSRNIQFGWSIPESSHFLLALSVFHPYPAPWTSYEGRMPRYRATFKGYEVLSLYDVPAPTYDIPLELPVGSMRGTTGRVVQLHEPESRVLRANPLKHQEGFLLVRQPLLRAPEPARAVTLDLSISLDQQIPDANAVVGSLIMSSRCSREILAPELALNPSTVSITCPADHEGPFGPAFYWRGQHMITIYSATVRAGAGAPK